MDFIPSKDNTRQLRDAFGRFATGITIVTVGTENGPAGIVVNSFSSVSLDPALVLWSLAHESNRYARFRDAEHYAIHVLASDQKELCELVARDGAALRTGDHPYELSPEGIPILDGALARFECKREVIHTAGDHDVIIGQVLRAELRDGEALTFYSGQYGTLSAS